MERLLGYSVILALVLGGYGCGSKPPRPGDGVAHAAPDRAKSKYHCPMHPTYLSDRPGSCPICGMDLVPIDSDGSAPIGGAAAVEGRTAIRIAADRREQIGLTTEPVARRTLARTIRAPATVELDETRRTLVSPRVGGWVQELYVDSYGQAVKKGDPLFKLYSPDLLATQTDYLQALKTGHAAVIAAARRRLELWDIGAAQLDEIEGTGRAGDTMVVLAPADGVVVKKDAVQGQAFSPGEALFEIADLTHLWIHAFLYEQEVPLLKVGQRAVVELAYTHRSCDARVSFIYPTVDAISRTVEVRLAVENPDLVLKPGMWATVEIEQDLGEVLAVPASAILQTGRRSLAFVDRDNGHLEPREVTIGGRSDDYWEIRAGLQEGERVVTRALFLVDSESQLKAAIAGLATGHGDQP